MHKYNPVTNRSNPGNSEQSAHELIQQPRVYIESALGVSADAKEQL